MVPAPRDFIQDPPFKVVLGWKKTKPAADKSSMNLKESPNIVNMAMLDIYIYICISFMLGNNRKWFKKGVLCHKVSSGEFFFGSPEKRGRKDSGGSTKQT